ncbi:MAG: anthranilate synthase component I family protein [Candidatus Bathyarchaeia archaeon]
MEAFSRLEPLHDHAVLLESAEGPEKLASFSHILVNPEASLRLKDGRVEASNGWSAVLGEGGDPLHPVRLFTGAPRMEGEGHRFSGGMVGYLSYELARYWERLPSRAVDELMFPDLEMDLFLDGLLFDHRTRQLYYHHLGRDRSREIMEELKAGDGSDAYSTVGRVEVNVSEDEFKRMVEEAKSYISEGEIFQVVLSKRSRLRARGSLLGFYKALRRLNPSPYMYYVKMDARRIVGSSPEMLVRVEDGLVETYPIAGTRPATGDPRGDEAAARSLLSDPKERAEHVMLVDLARNDLGRVSEHGSVKVTDFMTVQKYSHVMHMVSRVVGRLRGGLDSLDVMRAVFPAGTVSGAPKVRAMEIIEELEPSRRGPYAGAVGYFSLNGCCDFAITIRTLVADGEDAYIQAGAGIVADSNPEAEWLETEHKARALLRALEEAEGES